MCIRDSYTPDGVSLGFRAFYQTIDGAQLNTANYVRNAAGVLVNFGFPLNEFDTLRLSPGYQHIWIGTTTNTPIEIFEYLKENGDTYDQLTLDASWARDSRNRTIFPSSGSLNQIAGQFALPGSTAVSYTHLDVYKRQAVIGQVTRGGAAERAGLQPGDQILLAESERVKDWLHLRDISERHPGKPFSVRVDGKGTDQGRDLSPYLRDNQRGEHVGFMGAIADVPDDLAQSLRVVVRYGPLDAVSAALGKTWDMSLLTLRMLGRMLVGRASLDLSLIHI